MVIPRDGTEVVSGVQTLFGLRSRLGFNPQVTQDVSAMTVDRTQAGVDNSITSGTSLCPVAAQPPSLLPRVHWQSSLHAALGIYKVIAKRESLGGCHPCLAPTWQEDSYAELDGVATVPVLQELTYACR